MFGGRGGTVLDRLIVQLVARGDTTGIKQFMRSFEELETKAQRAIGNVERAADKIGGTFIKVGAAASGAAIGMVMEAARVETAWGKIAATTSTPIEHIDFLKQKVRELGAEVGKSEASLSRGLIPILSAADFSGDMEKQKNEVARAVEILGEATKLSETGMGEVAELGRAFSVMAINFPDVPVKELAAKLAQLVEMGNFNPEELGGQAASLVRLVLSGKAQLEDVLGMSAVATKLQGRGLSEAVRTGNVLVEKMIRPFATGRKVYAKLAEQFGDTGDDPALFMERRFAEILKGDLDTGMGTGVVGAFRELDRLLRAESEGDDFTYQRNLQMVLGRQDAVDTFRLLSKNLGLVEESIAAVFDPRETTSRMEDMKDTVSVTFIDMVESAQNAAKALGQYLLPPAKKLFDTITGILNKVGELPEGLQKVIAFGVLGGSALLPLGFALKLLAFSLRGVSGALKIMKGVLGVELVASAAASAKATQTAQLALGGLGLNAKAAGKSLGTQKGKAGLLGKLSLLRFLLPAILNPVVLVGLGAVALLTVAKNWDAISEAISNAWFKVRQYFSEEGYAVRQAERELESLEERRAKLEAALTNAIDLGNQNLIDILQAQIDELNASTNRVQAGKEAAQAVLGQEAAKQTRSELLQRKAFIEYWQGRAEASKGKYIVEKFGIPARWDEERYAVQATEWEKELQEIKEALNLRSGSEVAQEEGIIFPDYGAIAEAGRQTMIENLEATQARYRAVLAEGEVQRPKLELQLARSQGYQDQEAVTQVQGDLRDLDAQEDIAREGMRVTGEMLAVRKAESEDYRVRIALLGELRDAEARLLEIRERMLTASNNERRRLEREERIAEGEISRLREVLPLEGYSEGVLGRGLGAELSGFERGPGLERPMEPTGPIEGVATQPSVASPEISGDAGFQNYVEPLEVPADSAVSQPGVAPPRIPEISAVPYPFAAPDIPEQPRVPAITENSILLKIQPPQVPPSLQDGNIELPTATPEVIQLASEASGAAPAPSRTINAPLTLHEGAIKIEIHGDADPQEVGAGVMNELGNQYRSLAEIVDSTVGP